MNVHAEDVEKMIVEDFWPKHVYCRPWVSKEKLAKLPTGSEAEGSKEKV